jgi:magnesium chelatase subunit D
VSSTARWADALTALALFAVDPVGLGGISVRAGAGPVRDHWLDLLREVLPDSAPCRRVPLHAGDERLLGGLDLAATLSSGRPIARPGLLAEADGGVLILAMAERIDASATGRLCAALDEGAVNLERDGLALRMPARCGMVALDEGATEDERPPRALLDRLAFHLDLTDISIRDIVEAGWDVDLIADARARLESIETHPDAVEALCSAAMALGVESPRAPLFALRAARAHAAMSERDEATEADIGMAARLVFAHRATKLPPNASETPPEAEEHQPPPETDISPAEDKPNEDESNDDESVDDRPLEDQVLAAAQAALPANLLSRLALMAGQPAPSRVTGRVGELRASRARGRPIGTRAGDPRGGARLHVLETLKAAAPWQGVRRTPAAPGRFEVRREDFRIIRFRQRTGTTTVFAVDASGSAALNRLAEAKGAVELLLADCYVRRDQVALIAFRGQEATMLLPPTGSLLRAKRCLAGLPGGGPTPLASGIAAATALADTVRRGGRTPIVTFLTDARANIARDGTGGRALAEADALENARALAALGIAALLLDTSPRPNPFAQRLAEAMHAQYLPLPYADASAVSRAVRSVGA